MTVPIKVINKTTLGILIIVLCCVFSFKRFSFAEIPMMLTTAALLFERYDAKLSLYLDGRLIEYRQGMFRVCSFVLGGVDSVNHDDIDDQLRRIVSCCADIRAAAHSHAIGWRLVYFDRSICIWIWIWMFRFFRLLFFKIVLECRYVATAVSCV